MWQAGRKYSTAPRLATYVELQLEFMWVHLVGQEPELCQDSDQFRRMRRKEASQHQHMGFLSPWELEGPLSGCPSFSAFSPYCICMHKCTDALGLNVASSRFLTGPRPQFPSQSPKFLGKPDRPVGGGRGRQPY